MVCKFTYERNYGDLILIEKGIWDRTHNILIKTDIQIWKSRQYLILLYCQCTIAIYMFCCSVYIPIILILQKDNHEPVVYF